MTTGTPASTGLLRFGYGPFDEEIARKLASDRATVGFLSGEALDVIAGLGAAAGDRRLIGGLVERLAAETTDGSAYVSHALRVMLAHAVETGRADVRTLVVGLLHNVVEVGSGGLRAAADDLLDETGRRALHLLAIDRSRERDAAYLDAYYDAIAAAPGELMILKGVDKLDNLLTYVCGDVDPFHFECVETWVCPRLHAVAPRLADYLERLCGYVQRADVRRRHRKRATPAATSPLPSREGVGGGSSRDDAQVRQARRAGRTPTLPSPWEGEG